MAVILPQKPKPGKKPVSVNQILRASYRRFAKDKETHRAVKLILRPS